MKGETLKKILLIGALLIIFILWQAVKTISEYYPITNYPPTHKGQIMFLGNQFCAQGVEGFVSILSQRLGVPINDQSSSTSSIDLMGTSLTEKLNQLEPSVVIFCFAPEDSSGKTEAYFTALRTMIISAQKHGVVTVLLGANRETRDSSYNKHIGQIARATGSLTVPNILEPIALDAKYWNEQQPNNSGNLKIADFVAPTLEGLVMGMNENTSTTP